MDTDRGVMDDLIKGVPVPRGKEHISAYIKGFMYHLKCYSVPNHMKSEIPAGKPGEVNCCDGCMRSMCGAKEWGSLTQEMQAAYRQEHATTPWMPRQWCVKHLPWADDAIPDTGKPAVKDTIKIHRERLPDLLAAKKCFAEAFRIARQMGAPSELCSRIAFSAALVCCQLRHEAELRGFLLRAHQLDMANIAAASMHLMMSRQIFFNMVSMQMDVSGVCVSMSPST
mmetsp:Transcript_36150/g.90960  ORF Transcript_36150/g.90960 Transcript_36150/m.90960 type:complete len:226 (+) Transcript_36150:852-1529(+)